jgi:hypothetical protein
LLLYSQDFKVKGEYMLLTVFIVLVVLWALGILAHIGGALINLVLLIALIVLVFDFVTRRRV